MTIYDLRSITSITVDKLIDIAVVAYLDIVVVAADNDYDSAVVVVASATADIVVNCVCYLLTASVTAVDDTARLNRIHHLHKQLYLSPMTSVLAFRHLVA